MESANFGAANLPVGSYKRGMQVVRINATDLAESLRATVEEIRESGITSFAGIARTLNAQKIRTARGGKWHPTSVKRLLERLG